MTTLIKTSKLYNGKEHTFTTLGAATNVVLKSGNGEQFQIQGTLNIVDGPDNPADILINGNNIGSGTSLGDLSDVTLVPPLQEGSILTYTANRWSNSTVLEVPDIFTTNLIVSNNFDNEFSVLEVTSIQRLKCDNIRTGLTDCLLRANAGERIVPAYVDADTSNLNLTDGFLALNQTIEATTVGIGCIYKGDVISSVYGGTGYNNTKGFINSTVSDLTFDQAVESDSNVTFGTINGTIVAGSPEDTGVNQTFLGNDINQYIDNDIESSTLIGNNSGINTYGLRETVMLGNQTGRFASGVNLTFVGHNVGGMSTTSSTNVILIGNNLDCDVYEDGNDYFKIQGAGDPLVVDPVIETCNMNDKTIMVTTLYGKTGINMSKMQYKDWNISFTTHLTFNQSVSTGSSPRFNDVGLYDLSSSYPMYLNCDETLSNSRTINLKCIDTDRDLTLASNLTVTSNSIVVGTNYIQTNYNSIAFGTDTRFTFGKIIFFSPVTMGLSPNYIKYGTSFLEPRYNSLSFGTDTTFTFGKLEYLVPTTLSVAPTYLKLANNYLLPTSSSLWVGDTSAGSWGKINWSASSTLALGANSYINQNLATTSTPTFQDIVIKRLDSQPSIVRITNNSNNSWDIQNNSNNNFTIDYNDTTYINVTSTGLVTKPYQSQFCAYLTADANDVTGDGTTWTVAFNGTKTNVGSNFNTANGIYTTPVAGVYLFTTSIKFSGITSSHTDSWHEIVIGSPTSMRISEINPYLCQSTGNYLVINGSTGPVYLNAGTNVYVNVHIYGGTKTVDVKTDGSTYLTSYFTGTLLG